MSNRRALHERLETLRPGDALLLADIDHFKVVNDTLGHAAGDDALVDFARLVSERLRGGQSAYRYGGEEFLVLCPAGAREVHDLDTRLRQGLRRALPALTYSAGVVVLGDADSAAAALHRADTALYRAKRAGRDRTVTDDGTDPARATADPPEGAGRTTSLAPPSGWSTLSPPRPREAPPSVAAGRDPVAADPNRT